MYTADIRHCAPMWRLLSLYKSHDIKSAELNITYAQNDHRFKTDEAYPDIYKNVDLVRKPEPKNHLTKKAC